MKPTITPKQAPNVEKLKAMAFCLKVSCDAMVDVPKEWEDKVDQIEDFAECAYEKLTRVTSQTSVDKLLTAGNLIGQPKDLERVVSEMMKILDGLVKESRRALDLPTELLFVKLFKEGLCTFDKKKKEKSEK